MKSLGNSELRLFKCQVAKSVLCFFWMFFWIFFFFFNCLYFFLIFLDFVGFFGCFLLLGDLWTSLLILEPMAQPFSGFSAKRRGQTDFASLTTQVNLSNFGSKIPGTSGYLNKTLRFANPKGLLSSRIQKLYSTSCTRRMRCFAWEDLLRWNWMSKEESFS